MLHTHGVTGSSPVASTIPLGQPNLRQSWGWLDPSPPIRLQFEDGRFSPGTTKADWTGPHEIGTHEVTIFHPCSNDVTANRTIKLFGLTPAPFARARYWA